MPLPRSSHFLPLIFCLSHCATPARETEEIAGTWALPISSRSGQIETQDNRQTIKLPVDQFEDSSFDRFGFYDGSGRYEHAYGGDGAGAFIYPFTATDDNPRTIEVRARLSAESSGIGAPKETSDVTLSINGQAQGRKTVRADDGLGAIYVWTIKDPKAIKALKLRQGNNELRFEVESNAANRRGLCIYGRSLDGTSGATPITISMELNSSTKGAQ